MVKYVRVCSFCKTYRQFLKQLLLLCIYILEQWIFLCQQLGKSFSVYCSAHFFITRCFSKRFMALFLRNFHYVYFIIVYVNTASIVVSADVRINICGTNSVDFYYRINVFFIVSSRCFRMEILYAFLFHV